jgi:pimeloyl-ACP methyl ester carboxylesterase
MDPAVDDVVQKIALTTRGVGPLSALRCVPESPRGTIVALHGGGTRASYWDAPHAPDLSFMRAAHADGWAVIAVDRPGYGLSRNLSSLRLHAAAQARIIHEAVAENIGDGPVALVAHSLGSIVAAHAAAGAWDGPLSGVAVQGMPLAYTPLQVSTLAKIDVSGPVARHPGGGASLDIDQWFGPEGTWDRRVLDHFSTIMASTPSGEMEDARDAPDVLPALLAATSVPVQLCVGEHEMSTAPADEIAALARQVLAKNDHHEVHVIEGGAHNLSLGNAATELNSVVLHFLDNVCPVR